VTGELPEKKQMHSSKLVAQIGTRMQVVWRLGLALTQAILPRKTYPMISNFSIDVKLS